MIDYSTLPYIVEPMQVRDIDECMLIEREAFSAPWSASAYRHELEHNEIAYYYVVRHQHAPAISAQRSNASQRRLLQSFFPKRSAPSEVLAAALPPVLAYGGLWVMIDEAHISTIATAREWRGKGIGELLLVGMMEHAHALGAETITLEVRVSNLVAQGLYRKYGFQIEGRRKRYYSDNGEDALIMTSPAMHEEAYEELIEELKTKVVERLRNE